MNNINKPLVSLKEANVTGVVIDFMLLVFANLIMDGGVIFCATFCLVVGPWVGNVVIILRRKHSLTRFGRDFLRFGAFLLAVLAISAVYCIGYISSMFS